MRSAAIAAALAVAVAGCGPRLDVAGEQDPLCAALVEVHAAGLVASLSGVPRVLGEDADRADADARARAVGALRRFREAAPAHIADDAARVTDAIESFVLVLNNPVDDPMRLLRAMGSTPEGNRQLRASAERVNAVTQERCGETLMEPGALQPAA